MSSTQPFQTRDSPRGKLLVLRQISFITFSSLALPFPMTKTLDFLSSNIKQGKVVSLSQVTPNIHFILISHSFLKFSLFRVLHTLLHFSFPNVSPVSLSGLSIPPCPMCGSLPWHLSLAVFRSRPNAEPGRSCLFSAWRLCGQQTQHLMTSWHM